MNINIKKYRLLQKMTLQDLSKLTNLSAGYICHLENGDRTNPSYNVIAKIAKALNTPIDKIFFS